MAASIRNRTILLIAIGAILSVTFVLYFNSLSPKNDHPSGSVERDRIVFSGMINSTKHQIFIVNSDGTHLKNLTSVYDDLWHFDPVPSPDGSKVAYETWDNFPDAPPGGRITQNLYVVKNDGTGKIRLTPNDTIDISSKFSWSPDSNKIAYGSSEDIYVVNADGTNTFRLTHDGKPVGQGLRIANYNPFWLSNDTIVFSAVTFNGTHPIGGSFREVLTSGILFDLFEFDVGHTGSWTWSNDRKHIALLRQDSNDQTRLYLMDSGDNRPRILVDSSAFYSISDLAWSPDDSMISFVGIERSKPEEASPSAGIFVVKVGDGSFSRLPGSQTLNTMPVWSSEGTKVAFMSPIGEEAISISLIDVNSNEKNEVIRIEQSIVNQPLNWIPSNNGHFGLDEG